jgi:hypothetical protein
MAELSLQLKQLAKLINSECIYKEGGLILHVQVKGVSIQDDMIEITLLPIHSIGFGTRQNRLFKISSVTELISIKNNRIANLLINSELFTRKKDVDRLVSFAAALPDLKSFINEIKSVRKEEICKL